MFNTWTIAVLLIAAGAVCGNAHADSNVGEGFGVARAVAWTALGDERNPAAVATDPLLNGAKATSNGGSTESSASVPSVALTEQQRQGFVGFTGRESWPEGEVALTFDDGPHVTHTPKILNLLRMHQLQATFFVVGQNINRYTFRLIQRMVQDGHQIGSHSYNHDVKMAHRPGRNVVDYIRGEHEVTRILVNLALSALDADDFDRMYQEVFRVKPGALLSNQALAANAGDFLSRYQALLVRRGIADGRDPYPIVFTRPPGGGPYLGQAREARQRYDLALKQLGLINVLWHGGCWDPDPMKRKDYAFIFGSLLAQWRRGGIVVIHDYVRFDALANAVGRLASSKGAAAVLLDTAMTRKYGATANVVAAELRHSASAVESPVAPKNESASTDNQLARSSHRARPGQS